MLNLKAVTDLAAELGQSRGKVLAALKNIHRHHPVLFKARGQKTKRVWHVDMSALTAFYGQNLVDRVVALEEAVFGKKSDKDK